MSDPSDPSGGDVFDEVSNPSLPTLRRRKGPLQPNPALWAALDSGRKLRAILEDFYARVYEDKHLKHFFHGATQARAVDKQYSFLMEIFTGERVYFGDRPRNAHHWMVISHELFDYREALMENCLRRHGLAEEHVKAWLAAEEVFRRQIVKSAPVPRRMAGIEMPLDGWSSLMMTSGGVCDGCSGEIERDASAHYHVRTGRTVCITCAPKEGVHP